MSYVALYRKYRPQKFSDVVNQNHIKKTLINALALNKVAHAYLFSGPRGVGKTTIGRLLAKAINCTDLNKNIGEACNKCLNCKEIFSEKSVDINEIDAASNRGIDEIRELREKIKYMPSKLDYRVFIIDEVHMLTIEAFNALLKTLEEPPKHVIFILATTEPQKIPATILSRCQRFDFKKISIDELIKHLKGISKKEKINISEGALRMIALNSDGSSRDSLSLLGQVQSAFDKGEIKEDDIIDLLGLASDNMIFDLAETILKNDIRQSLEKANNLIMRGYDPILLLDSLIDFMRNLLLFKNTNNEDIILAHKDKKDRLNGMLEKNDNRRILFFINNLIEAKNNQKYSSISQLPLEMAIIKFINPEEESIKKEKKEDINNSSIINTDIKKNIKDIKTPKENLNTSNNPKEAVKNIDYASIDSKWAEIVENVANTNYSLGLTLRSSKPIKVSENNLILECGYGFHKDCIEKKKNREIVENMISKKTGMPVYIKCVIAETKPENNFETEQNNKKEIEDGPDLVNTALDIMGGEIVK